jgi:Zn-dependent M28 family amino/carboxypeptidase
MLSFPRHYVAERQANVRARDMLLRLLHDFGYTLHLVGSYDNIMVTSGGPTEGPYLLLGAHYDSVPGTPGADDNASAVAACLECARLLRNRSIPGTMIVLFNREEDGLLGSREFVQFITRQSGMKIAEAHVFEMVGYCTRAPGSQRMPPGLPGMFAPDVGDFIGLLANQSSNFAAEALLSLASTYLPRTPVVPVIALKFYLGIERFFGHLHRSDHAPFWEAGIPAVMWTDTAEFRNPNYHRATDTPDTLDYAFLTQVTQLALARAATRALP